MKPTFAFLAILSAPAVSFAQSANDKAAVFAAVDDIQSRMVEVNRAIWSYAELGLEEVRSSKELRDWLAANGFSVRAGVAGMPTAFVASYGEGQPVIAYLAEYDALGEPIPGLPETSPAVAAVGGILRKMGFGSATGQGAS